MSNQLYDDARFKLSTGSFDWRAIDLVLTAWAGTPDYAQTDRTLSDIVGRGGVALGHSMPVTSKTVSSDGTVQTNQVIIPAVPIGQNVTWFTFAKRTATVNLSELIEFIDDVDGLPFVPNGLDMVINPDWVQDQGWWRP